MFSSASPTSRWSVSPSATRPPPASNSGSSTTPSGSGCRAPCRAAGARAGGGYSTAAPTLVGASDDDLATAYGWQTLRIALATQPVLAAALVATARPIAVAFGTDHVDLTVTFVRVFGVVVGFSISRTMRGGLRGAGDTRWPLYATTAGAFLVRPPVAALALPAGFAVTLFGVTLPVGAGVGLSAVYVAIVADVYTEAAVDTGRFWSGRWRVVARAAGV